MVLGYFQKGIKKRGFSDRLLSDKYSSVPILANQFPSGKGYNCFEGVLGKNFP